MASTTSSFVAGDSSASSSAISPSVGPSTSSLPSMEIWFSLASELDDTDCSALPSSLLYRALKLPFMPEAPPVNNICRLLKLRPLMGKV